MDFLIEEDENRDMMEEDVPAEIESELESPLELILRQELSKLNPNQRAAVTHGVENGLQILAGPGSGKTKVLTPRVYYLIQNFGISPENLMVVTFTNKSAKEMIKVR